MWVHPINNLRFEKGEYFILYPDLHKYEDKFFNCIVCQWKISITSWKWYNEEFLDVILTTGKQFSTEEQLVITLT